VAQLIPAAVSNTEDGLTMIIPDISSKVLKTHFAGDFNADNILLVAGWSKALCLPLDALRKAFMTVHVPGRFDMVWNDKRRRVIVDYAHTPDALERVLRTAKSLCRGTLSVVFGCGGDRDRTKRPIMGGIAENEADKVWVTSDNPRTENPETIIQEILAGMHTEKFQVMVQREDAIAAACRALRDGDWLVVAGKGHEDYQIIGRTKHHFDDREMVCREMEKC
jgi:UDP-N-acetylmuramoyl-L-alanyl-D-glutamate--2,6-diaminopimelate ligase